MEAPSPDPVYTQTTRDIEISVLPEFSPDRSDERHAQYFWLYTVEIANGGSSPVQVTHRHWRITDANGRLQEVKGEGIVGKQPVLQPGDVFRYTSGCPLSTPSGIMAGTYRIVVEGGDTFEAEVPTFSLDQPSPQRVLN
jgi:ApaG protein